MYSKSETLEITMGENNELKEEPVYQEPEKSTAGTVLWIIGALIILFLAGFLSFAANSSDYTGNRASTIGYYSGLFLAPFIFAGIVTLLFMIGKRFRNLRSAAKIAFFTGLIMLISSLANLGNRANANRPGSFIDLSISKAV